jgi:hypothetical protein
MTRPAGVKAAGNRGAAMPYEKSVHVQPGGIVIVECGPMRLSIDARIGRVPQPRQSARAADAAVAFLEGVAAARPLLGPGWRRHAGRISDPLALRMVASVRAVGDEDLTPMAAVAGTLADAVADLLVDGGMTRVIVENGGDIAIRVFDGEPVTVGIRPEVGRGSVAAVVTLGAERTSWGVATSGLGGRSLTRGILDAATVVAADAAGADAAATAVANASYREDPAVIRAAAEALDPHTDIPGLAVTRRVGDLPEETLRRALAQSLRRAEELVERNIIYGAFVAVRGRMAATRFIEDRMLKEADAWKSADT